jgi:hypothetical protein
MDMIMKNLNARWDLVLENFKRNRANEKRCVRRQDFLTVHRQFH